MPEYMFKLLGGFGDRAEADLTVQYENTVAEVKEIVRSAFKLIPSMQLELMVGGRKLPDDKTWGSTDAKPMKTTVLVIGHR